MSVFVLSWEAFYDGSGGAIGLYRSLEGAKAEAECIEHGQRWKPREYEWENGNDESDTECWWLKSTRGDEGRWSIEEMEVSP